MSDRYAQSVLDGIARIGRGTPVLVCASGDEASFGDANVTLEVDGLRLHVVNDRGTQTVEVGLKIVDPLGPRHPALAGFLDGAGQPTCPLEALAVANEWITLEQLVAHYDLDAMQAEYDEETPPPGPFYELTEAMLLLADDEKWNELVAASENHRSQIEAGEIEEALQKKLEAQLGV